MASLAESCCVVRRLLAVTISTSESLITTPDSAINPEQADDAQVVAEQHKAKNRANDAERNAQHDEHWLKIAPKRNGQQAVDTQQRKHKADAQGLKRLLSGQLLPFQCIAQAGVIFA